MLQGIHHALAVSNRQIGLFADGHVKSLKAMDTIAGGVNMWTRDNSLAVSTTASTGLQPFLTSSQTRAQ